MTDRMTITTKNLEFSTTPSMKPIPDDCDNDRQPEMELDNCNCHGQLPGFTIMNIRMTLCIANVQN